MQGEFLSEWLLHYDPIHLGWTPRGIANAVCATNGWCFPRVGGGYNLYRGTPTEAGIDYSRPVGAAGPQSRVVLNFMWAAHAPSTGYAYTVKAIGGGGVESEPASPAVPVAFDGSGSLIGARPNSPLALGVTPLAGGRFLLRWTHSSLGEAATPVEFRVYTDPGTGVIDYDSAVGAVPFAFRRTFFSFASIAHAHGAKRRWAVRAYSAAGEHDGNTEFAEFVADANGPEPVAQVLGECLEA